MTVIIVVVVVVGGGGDFVSGDELISDSFDLKEVDGVAYEVKCKKIKVGGESIDVGGNPSAEGGGEDEGVDDAVETKFDVPAAMRLELFGDLNKDDYKKKLKTYLKKIKERLQNDGKSEDEIKDFEKRAQNYVKTLLQRWSGITFYLGESGVQMETKVDKDGKSIQVEKPYIPFWYDGEDPEPIACFWKDGLTEMKV
ncbi:MAG: hypothetical protein Q9162_007248 [Coniocarpon cinnabarinum]